MARLGTPVVAVSPVALEPGARTEPPAARMAGAALAARRGLPVVLFVGLLISTFNLPGRSTAFNAGSGQILGDDVAIYKGLLLAAPLALLLVQALISSTFRQYVRRVAGKAPELVLFGVNGLL